MHTTDGRRLARRTPLLAPAAAVATLTLGALLIAVPSALAQAPASRVFISVNGGIQTGGQDLSVRGEFDNMLFGSEKGSFEATQAASNATLYDVGGGVKVAGNLALGVSFTQSSREGAAAVSGKLPHPFFFNRPRSVSGMATDLKRAERAVHIQAMYAIPAGDSFVLTLFGGPTWFNVSQDLVSGIRFNQTYPFDSATVDGVTSGEQSASAIGFHAGADAAFYFSRLIGVGATVRWSRGTVEFEPPTGAVESQAGGVQTSGGLRLRF